MLTNLFVFGGDVLGVAHSGVFFEAAAEVVGVGNADFGGSLIHLHVGSGYLHGFFHAKICEVFDEVAAGLLLEFS